MLAFTANHCRVPVTRRHALRLMEDYDREEALTPSYNFATASRQLIEIEERACARPPRGSSDIASHQRVRSMDMTFLPSKKNSATVTHGLLKLQGGWLADDNLRGLRVYLKGQFVDTVQPETWFKPLGSDPQTRGYIAMIYRGGSCPEQP
jgi:hypothetical protein